MTTRTKTAKLTELEREIAVLKVFTPKDYPAPETTVEDRFRVIVDTFMADRGSWEKLAASTKIPSQRWRSVYAGRQRLTTEMLQAVTYLLPHYAFWLASGLAPELWTHATP